MNKQRLLTEWELSQLQGMRAMTPEEMVKAQGIGARALSKEEMEKRQIENAPLMQNHLWPWEEKDGRE